MTETRPSLDLALPTVGPRPSPLLRSAPAKFNALALLQCPNCRNQLQDLGDSPT